jgi:hypothetical protein
MEKTVQRKLKMQLTSGALTSTMSSWPACAAPAAARNKVAASHRRHVVTHLMATLQPIQGSLYGCTTEIASQGPEDPAH